MFDELLDAGAGRRLEAAEPQTFVEGGGTMDRRGRPGVDTEPTADDLERWEDAYRNDGPVGHLLDQRALMTFGVGTEWTTDADDVTAVVDGESLTPAEYLEAKWPTRERDSFLVRTGTTCYWAGFATFEPIRTTAGDLVPSSRPFHGFEYVHPATVEAFWDDKGRLREWVQHADADGLRDNLETRLDVEDIAVFTLLPKGRHPLGLSVVGRGWEDIQRHRENQRAIAESLHRFAYAGWHVQVGREDGPAIDDNELRRVRSRFRQVEGAKNLVTGTDIGIDPLEVSTFGDGIAQIAENDIRNLATTLGIPLEWTNYGGDGLGTGTPAESRQTAFERQARAEQRRLTSQLVEQVARPMLAESPFPDDVPISLSWGDVVSDQQAIADWLQRFAWAYTRDEIREKLGDAAFPDDAASEAPPELAPSAREETGGDAGMAPGGGGGLFASADGGTTGRHLGTGAPWERALDQVFERVVWGDDPGRSLFAFDPEDVPDFAIERLRGAILDGTVFAAFETVPDGARAALRDALLDSLEARHGWSVDSIADNLQDAVGGLDRQDAERIARTETAAITNRAREMGYEDRVDVDAAQFYWQGPDDHRTTDACEWLKERTNPDHGGDPVSLADLKGLVQDANDRFVEDHDARELVPHISCRHTFVRNVS